MRLRRHVELVELGESERPLGVGQREHGDVLLGVRPGEFRGADLGPALAVGAVGGGDGSAVARETEPDGVARLARVGRALQQVASPLDLYYRPANRFVAEFIGDPSMNVFEVAVTGSTDSTATLANEHLEIEIRDDDSTIASGDGVLHLGVRPESFSFPEDSEPENAIEATVEVVEPMGNVTHVHFTVGDGEYTATVPGRRIPEERQNVRFAVPEETVYVFDASGDAVRHPNVDVERQSVGDLH